MDVLGDDSRTAFQRDRDRILYSGAFRRLDAVTQVASANELHLFHNRLTHSLKVAQIGRRLTESLIHRYPAEAEALALNPDVVESAGLAHDLGHPPFGHVAEWELNEIMQPAGGFEGNAQTFRILTKTAVKKPSKQFRRRMTGLDLTRATLAGVLKYPLLPGQTPDGPPTLEDRSKAIKAGVYDSEAAAFTFAREGSGIAQATLSPSAVLMDWADDVSYATHDIEDYVRAGVVPMHDLEAYRDVLVDRVERRLQKKAIAYSEQGFDDAMDSVLAHLPFSGRYTGSNTDDYELQSWVSAQIQACETAVSLHATAPYVRINTDTVYLVELLKAVTWEFVIDAPALAAAQEGQRRLVRELFERTLEWSTKRQSTMPVRLRDLIANITMEEPGADETIEGSITVGQYRAIGDYICSLTEPQTIDLFQRITGVASASIYGGWLS